MHKLFWRRISLVLLAMVFIINMPVALANATRSIVIGRYLNVTAKPPLAQVKLLQQQIQIKFPQNILTIKQAVNFILQFSGYRLASSHKLQQPARHLLAQPLPVVDQLLGPFTLAQGLMTLSGQAFYLLVDPVNRLIAYKIKRPYHTLYLH